MQEKVVRKRERLVRKQILITPEQNRRLKALAESQGVPEAELIRAAIDRATSSNPPPDDWKQRLQKACGTFSIEEADDLESTVRENRAAWNRSAERTRRRMQGED